MNIRRLKFCAVLAATLLLLGTLAGCSGKADKQVVNILSANYESQIALQLEYLREKYPDAEIIIPEAVVAELESQANQGREIGFSGLLMTDDLNMQALAGTLFERTVRSVAAGCDIALHCKGDFAEMQAVARAAGDITDYAVSICVV